LRTILECLITINNCQVLNGNLFPPVGGAANQPGELFIQSLSFASALFVLVLFNMMVTTTESPALDTEKQNINDKDTKSENVAANPSSSLSMKQLPFDPNMKHPLRHGWTLWYDGGGNPSKSSKSSQQSWGDNIKEVYSFASVEDFWRLINNIAKPSQLQHGCTYNLFKKGITPKWEDESNKQGGKWTILVGKGKGALDREWLWLILACIGAVLEDDGEEQICGAVVNVRKAQDKICLWTRDAENQQAVLHIGYALKRALEITETSGTIGYQGHFQKNTRSNKYEI